MKAERMMENIEAMNRPLSEAECRYLDLETEGIEA